MSVRYGSDNTFIRRFTEANKEEVAEVALEYDHSKRIITVLIEGYYKIDEMREKKYNKGDKIHIQDKGINDFN